MRPTLSLLAAVALAAQGCSGSATPELAMPLPAFLAQGPLPVGLGAHLQATRTESNTVEVNAALTIDTTTRTANGQFDVKPGTYELVIDFELSQVAFARITVPGVLVTGGATKTVDFTGIAPQDLGVDTDGDGLTDLQELTYGLDPLTKACATGCTDTHVSGGGITVDAYEASVWSDPACKGTQYGAVGNDYPAGFPADAASQGVAGTTATTTLYACSVAGVLPSRFVSWNQAKLACENAGKVLCSGSQWQTACKGPDNCVYPYATSGACSCAFLCTDSGCNYGQSGAHAQPTGVAPLCQSGYGAYDMSGNAWEWTSTCASGQCEMRGGSLVLATLPPENPSCADVQSAAATASTDATVGFRCCAP